GFVEKQYCTALLGSIEHAPKIFFRFTDVFADDLAQVDAVQIKAHLGGKNFSGKSLARSTLAGKEGCNSQASGVTATESPMLVDSGPLARVNCNLLQNGYLRFVQDQIFPTCRWLD